MTLKFYLILCFIALIQTTGMAQEFPSFLVGTWNVNGSNNYEHWDNVDHQTLKGFMFKLESDLPVVSEYLEIRQDGGDIVYFATVLDQNEGESIPFTLHLRDSIYSFENPEHDFPRIIRYTPLSDHKISVFVGTEDNGFELELVRAEHRK